MTMSSMKQAELRERRNAVMTTPSDLGAQAATEIGGAMNVVLADVFALYVKTKNFHWHMSGPHFRDYHLLLDEQADQVFAMTDHIAERVRKHDADYVEPQDMLAELREDNSALAAGMREAHELCERHRDIATASLLEVWIDETERRVWFLFESAGRPDSGGH